MLFTLCGVKTSQRPPVSQRAKLLVDLLGRVRCMPIAVQRVFYRVAYVFFIYLRQKGMLRRGEGNWPSDVKGELRMMIKEIIRKYD